jgi:hypothetical protein
MLSCRKSVAALTALTAALAVAVSATTASAATAPTVDPQVCQLLNLATGPFGPTQFFGGASLASVLANAGGSVSCPAPAPQASPLPAVP